MVGGVTVGVDLLLLAIDRNLHVVRDRQKVTYGVMSADLAELAVARRVEVAGRRGWMWEKVHATDPRPTGDPLLDAALASLVAARRPPYLVSWIREPRTGLLDDYLAHLTAQGVVRPYPRRYTRQITHTEAAITDPDRQARARARVERFVAEGGAADPLDWALAGLVFESTLGVLLYPGRANRDAYRTLKEAARGDRGRDTGDPVEATIRAIIRATRNRQGATDG
jgi:Golgi phosphoprotein 3 (GPP34)